MVLWGLVSNAGIIGSFLPVDITPEEEFESVMSVNYMGAVRITKAFLPLIIKSRGRIVFTTSVKSFVPTPTLAGYVASKFALNAFSKVLHIEMGHFKSGVKVSSIHLSGLLTKLMSNVHDQRMRILDALSDEQKERYDKDYTESIVNQIRLVSDEALECSPIVSADLTEAVGCFEQALLSRYPQRDYHAGPMSYTFMLLYYLLPHCVYSFVICRMFYVVSPKWHTTQNGKRHQNGNNNKTEIGKCHQNGNNNKTD